VSSHVYNSTEFLIFQLWFSGEKVGLPKSLMSSTVMYSTSAA